MAEDNNNLSQDKKIDRLQFQMENIQGDIKDLKDISKETNNRLEVMQKGFVGREEFKEFQTFIGKLAVQRDLDETNRRINDLEDWQTWALRTVVGFIILATIGAVFVIK
jgi:hypothetical protein